jgi:hypothetical protein
MLPFTLYSIIMVVIDGAPSFGIRPKTVPDSVAVADKTNVSAVMPRRWLN